MVIFTMADFQSAAAQGKKYLLLLYNAIIIMSLINSKWIICASPRTENYSLSNQ